MTRTKKRIESLLPGGVPRYVRCYDNGGKTVDRYTVVFAGRHAAARIYRVFPYLGMSSQPFHPQGFGQHGETRDKPCDVDRWGFPPAMGRTGHLGKRIPFADLPDDCRKLVMGDYLELWDLKGGGK
jgi:hypothetical protein